MDSNLILKQKNKNKGQAVLIATIFFVVISMVVILGVALPIVGQIKVAGDLYKSRNSFFIAESAMDDVIYRLTGGYSVSSSETIPLEGGTAEVSITDTGSGKIITIEAEKQSYIRKIMTELVIGEGHAFSYGIQTGTGGFEIRNATVVGNIFGMGDLVGTHSGATATGSAIAANKFMSTPNQNNSTPIPSSKSIIFGDDDSTQDAAQSFKISQSGILSKIELYLKKTDYPNNLTVRIVENEAGFDRPSSTTTAQSILSASWITSKYGWVDAFFPSDTYLESGITYWMVIDASTNSDAYYEWASNDASYQNGKPMLGKFGNSWSTVSNHDGYFKIFLEGQKSEINNLNIGSGNEEAYAYEVENSDVNGEIFCQIGSGNNKACDTSRSDPNPQPFPISQGNIEQWKSDAEAGGVISGNYVANDFEQIGPKKIDGSFTLGANGYTLTLTGTLWVTGTTTIPNGSTIRLSPSFGTNSGIIITDSFIDLDNGIQFLGSGEEGSYIMLLTTSDCPTSSYCNGNNAIKVNNNAGAVILNAQKGTIHFNNNSGAKEATANKIVMENNSYVKYDSGLASVNFSSGPTGGFIVKNWREVK